MVKRAQTAEGADQGDIRAGRANHQASRQDKAGGGAESGNGIEDLAGLVRLTVLKLFPWFNDALDKIPDPRREHPKKKYPVKYLVWMAMLIFFMQSGSRRQYDLDKDTEAFLMNLLALAEIDDAEIDSLATAETADDLLQKVDPSHFSALRKMIVLTLIRGKRLESCKYKGQWRLAVDGTGIYVFKHRHCDHCQTRRNSKTGEVTYYHNVLEFKLVSPEGLAISLDSEFIENMDGQAKQDSELKAFYRAAPRIKKEWRCMRFLLLGDAIYANATVMDICRRNGWSYCFSLKDNLPTLKAEADRSLAKANPLIHIPEAGVEQVIRWVVDLRHSGFFCNVLACDETATVEDGTTKTTTYRWVSDLRPSKVDAIEMVNSVGRQRWKIENQGFKAQKHDGYKIEHGYGVTGHAWQNYYLIAQIVHAIMQMVTSTDAIHKIPSRRSLKDRGRPPPLLSIFKSMKNFFKRLAEAFRYCPPTWRDAATLGNFQLRYLNTT